MYIKQQRISKELEKAGFKYVCEATHPNICLPVALHECDERTYILVEGDGALSVVDKKDLSYSDRMPKRALDFFLKRV